MMVEKVFNKCYVSLMKKQLISRVIVDSFDEKDDANSIKVLIGGDGRFDEISELSVVVGRYGTNQLSGAISVLGQTRMRYGRAISTVRYVATLMSAMMQDIYGEDA